MVYKNNFVAVVKCNGKILREQDKGEVQLNFGSEYSLLLKNLNSKTAKVNIDIDGKDVLNGNSLIVYPNTDLELLGIMSGSIVKNKFKFIEKTREISKYRGDRIDDGLIRIEVTFEKDKPTYVRNDWYYSYPLQYNNSPTYVGSNYTYDAYVSGGIACSNTSLVWESNKESIVPLANTCVNQAYNVDNSEGITVKGSETKQDFIQAGYYDFEDNSEIIIIQLKGTNSKNQYIEKPITVKQKLKCETCGRISKSSSKFCSNCGTYL